MSKGGGVGGCLSWLGMLALGAGLGYNVWQVQRLQREVMELQAARGQRPSLSIGQSAPLLQEARAHAEKGQKLLKAGRFEEAKKELSLAAQKTQEASGAASSGRVSQEDLSKLLETLSRQAGTLWQQQKTEGKQQ